jgi:hypothetical protein
MFIVQCNVGAAAAGRPIPPPSAWRIPPVEDTIESVADDLLEGQYNNPVRVIGFDAAARTSRDVSGEVARELRQRFADQRRKPPEFLQEFLDLCAWGGGREQISGRTGMMEGHVPNVEKDVDAIVDEAAQLLRTTIWVTDVPAQAALTVLCEEIERLRKLRDGEKLWAIREPLLPKHKSPSASDKTPQRR